MIKTFGLWRVSSGSERDNRNARSELTHWYGREIYSHHSIIRDSVPGIIMVSSVFLAMILVWATCAHCFSHTCILCLHVCHCLVSTCLVYYQTLKVTENTFTCKFQDVCIEFKCERVCFEFQSRCQAEKSTETDKRPLYKDRAEGRRNRQPPPLQG